MSHRTRTGDIARPGTIHPAEWTRCLLSTFIIVYAVEIVVHRTMLTITVIPYCFL
jgi:hypothetical protein